MPKIAYIDKRFRSESLFIIETANEILADYEAQGFDLTLRQLYYQFIARELFPESWRDAKLGTKNTQKNYKRLGNIINDARLAGLIDWYRIEDRTRNLRGLSHWDEPADILRSAASSFRIDRWEEQDNYVEVWIEKDALVGVIKGVCTKYDVNFFSCRGYISQSEMWRAGRRLLRKSEEGKHCVVLQMSDHDPSGLDIKRDIVDRYNLFGANVEVRRLALTHEQVETYNPPPNPTKLSDSRAGDYVLEYGMESWEMDALEPAVLVKLIEDNILDLRDDGIWQETEDREDEGKKLLRKIADNWEDVRDFLNG